MPSRVRDIFAAATSRLNADTTGIITVEDPGAWDIIDFMYSGSGFCINAGGHRIALPQAIDSDNQPAGLFPFVISVIHRLAVQEARHVVDSREYNQFLEGVAWTVGASKMNPTHHVQDALLVAERALQQADANLRKADTLAEYTAFVCDALDVDAMMVTIMAGSDAYADLKRMHGIKRMIPVVLCPLPVLAAPLESITFRNLNFW